MPASEQHWLIIEDNQGKRTVVLEAVTCTVGRDSTNSIVLHSQLVSRQHAILLRVTTPETATHLFRLIDGNLQGKCSTNGITVNNQHCFSHDLKHGDVIVFGGHVQAKYCTTAHQQKQNLLTSSPTEQISSDWENLICPIQQPTTLPQELENSTESSLVRLASFPELLSNPILEIDLAGAITYLNPAALVQFPNIQAVKLQHPLFKGLIETVQNGKEKFFVRKVEVANKVFEQSVHYIAESDLIRSYVVDITAHKHTEKALRESKTKNQALFNFYH